NRSWEEWLAFMDSIGAADLDHTQIAVKVEKELAGAVDNPAWWAQGVTVAYEQHTGRRVPGQVADGTFQMNVSKATKLDMQALMDAWVAFAAADTRVTELIAEEPRRSGTDKRLNWRAKANDGSNVLVSSEPKPNGSASLVATLTGIASLELNEAAKKDWREILARFVASEY